MPLMRTVSDLQRSFSEVDQLCHETRKPVYITRNGQPDLVIMDADAYREQAILRQEIYEYEMELREKAIQAYEDIKAGKGVPLHELRTKMGLE